MNITQAELKELFDYDPDLGLLIRKNSRYKTLKAETTAYRFIRVKGKSLLMHRAIWCWHHGDWPKRIDHADGDKSNNRVENLRPCTQQQNMFNRAKKRQGKHKYKGLIYRPEVDAYDVQVRGVYGGRYKTDVEAAHAYDRLAKEMFGEFARLNFQQGEVND